MNRLLIRGATALTMDSAFRVLHDASILIEGDRIAAILGPQSPWPDDAEILSGEGMIALPGLIDAHGHGGHALLKHIASETPSIWGRVVTQTYFHFTDAAFWHADGQLCALERLMAGVTTGLSVIASEPRSDDPELALAHAAGHAALGVRQVVATGPCNPPWPRPASRWVDGERRPHAFTLEDALAGAAQVIRHAHGSHHGRTQVMLTPFVIVPSLDTSGPTAFDRAAALTENDRTTSRRVREVAREHGVRIHSDAFGGMVRLAAGDPHGLLGPDVLLQHCTGLSAQEVRMLADTGTSVGHAPLSGSLVRARCPVAELMEAGVTVAIVTDGAAPRTSFDVLPLPRIAQRLQQIHLQDMAVLPTGKALASITIDAARALGLEREIGSIEVGKKADLILLDASAPHLLPARMPVHRVVHAATGADVHTVIVDGAVRMRGRQVLGADPGAIGRAAEQAFETVVQRAGLEPFLEPTAGFWTGTFTRLEDDRGARIPV